MNQITMRRDKFYQITKTLYKSTATAIKEKYHWDSSE